MLKAIESASVELYYAGVKAFATTAMGIEVWDTSGDDPYINMIKPGGTSLGRIGVETSTFVIDTGSTNQSSIKATFDGSVELYYAGSKKVETVAAGIRVTDGSTSADVYTTGGSFLLRNNSNSGLVYLRGYNSGASEKNLFSGDPDGSAELYYAGVKSLATKVYGIGVYDNSGDDPKIEFFDSSGVVQGYINFTGTGEFSVYNFIDSQYHMRCHDVGAVELYWAGVKTFETKATGALVTGSMYLTEQAAALADVAAQGQLWVKNDDGNVLMFTDGDGTDYTVDLTPV
jgi:hypothetical protein